jgi:hypothetical protein
VAISAVRVRFPLLVQKPRRNAGLFAFPSSPAYHLVGLLFLEAPVRVAEKLVNLISITGAIIVKIDVKLEKNFLLPFRKQLASEFFKRLETKRN